MAGTSWTPARRVPTVADLLRIARPDEAAAMLERCTGSVDPGEEINDPRELSTDIHGAFEAEGDGWTKRAEALIADMRSAHDELMSSGDHLTAHLAPVKWSEMWAGDDEPPPEVVPFLLRQGEIGDTYAPQGAGKSLLSLEAAAAIATGGTFLDVAVARRSVLYVDAEMDVGMLRERLSAMGYGGESDLSSLAYYLLPDLPPFDTDDGGRALEQLIRRHKAELVVIDTTTSTTQGPESDADTYRNWRQHTLRRLRNLGVTAWRLDHTGKDLGRGQRGTSAKRDALDVSWSMSCKGDTITLTNTKARRPVHDQKLVLTRTKENSDGPLRHRLRDGYSVPPEVADVIADLKGVGWGPSWTLDHCQEILKDADKGRKRETVATAKRWLERWEPREPDPEPSADD